MVIESYAFGNIVIDGRRYTSDLIIYPDGRVVDGWWRSSGHLVTEADIAELIAAAPYVIVVGTGASGMLKPARGLERRLKKRGIQMFAAPCHTALTHFNELSPAKKVGACFHLTC
jgi:hypothetical protein